MSGRRRRDDEWDDGHRDAQDEGRDPWADSSVGEWGDRESDHGDGADWTAGAQGLAGAPGPAGSSGGEGAGARGGSGRGSAGPVGGQGAAKGKNAVPAFPSFQIGGGGGTAGRGSGRTQGGYDSADYGGEPGHGGQARGASSRDAAGYGGDGRRDGGYAAGRGAGSGGYRDPGPGQDPGYPRNGHGGRQDAAYDGSAGGYGQQGYASGGYGNDAGYGGGAAYPTNGRSAATVQVPGFTPADNDDAEDDVPAGTPRPMGRLSIYTLHEDKTKEFDRIAERAAEGVRAIEPDTLVFVIHVVPKAPMQRIIYEIYRDRAAFLNHERQPHIRQFAADRASCVVATNIIDLRLKYAKVAALGGAPEAGTPPQASWTPRAGDGRGPDSQPGSDRYQAPATQYQPAQYPGGQPRQQAVASFTPAADASPAEGRQYAATGREHFPAATQFGDAGNGAYDAAANGQYGAANSYSGAAGYANGGSYSDANGYPDANGYQGANGYSSNNGYQDANGYSNGNGYSNSSGYPGGPGYQGGYAGGDAYQNGADSGYGSGGRYDAPGGQGGAATAGSQGTQYTPRYRELTSGEQSDESGNRYRDNGARYGDSGRASARASDWNDRPQDQR